MTAAAEPGFTERVRLATGSQVPARLLIQTGRRLDQLTIADLDAFTAACHDRHERTGKGHHHYLAAVSNTQRVLSHLGILDQLPRCGGPVPFAERLAQVRPPIRATMIAYLDRKRATYQPKTVSGIATRLKHFRGVPRPRRSRAGLDHPPRPTPTHRALPDLAGRCGELQERRADHRRRPVPAGARADRVLDRHHRWGWPDAPPRKLVFRDDIPKLPQVLPRYLPVDVDRRLTQALVEHPRQRAGRGRAAAARCCGLRIGELLDLELDCVHELSGHGNLGSPPWTPLDQRKQHRRTPDRYRHTPTPPSRARYCRSSREFNPHICPRTAEFGAPVSPLARAPIAPPIVAPRRAPAPALTGPPGARGRHLPRPHQWASFSRPACRAGR
jgi:hypothetical protein